MSGGYFGFYEIDSELKNCWQDEEINELINDFSGLNLVYVDMVGCSNL